MGTLRLRIGIVTVTAVVLSISAVHAQSGILTPTDEFTLNSNWNSDSGDDVAPEAAADGQGNVIVVWYSDEDLNGAGTDDDILFAESDDDGETWSSPAVLNSNASSDDGADFEPMIATDRNGNWVTVWASSNDIDGAGSDDSDLFVWRRNNGASSWTTPRLLNSTGVDSGNSSPGLDYGIDLATGDEGRWIVVWSSSEPIQGDSSGDMDIHVSISDNNGTDWSDPVILHPNGYNDAGFDYDPEIATDRNGNWVTVWHSQHPISGSGQDKDVISSTSTDNGITWSSPVLVNDWATTDSSAAEFMARIATGGSGTWIAAWHPNLDPDTGKLGNDTDVYFAVSLNAGVSWGTADLLNNDGLTDSVGDRFAEISKRCGCVGCHMAAVNASASLTQYRGGYTLCGFDR